MMTLRRWEIGDRRPYESYNNLRLGYIKLWQPRAVRNKFTQAQRRELLNDALELARSYAETTGTVPVSVDTSDPARLMALLWMLTPPCDECIGYSPAGNPIWIVRHTARVPFSWR